MKHHTKMNICGFDSGQSIINCQDIFLYIMQKCNIATIRIARCTSATVFELLRQLFDTMQMLFTKQHITCGIMRKLSHNQILALERCLAKINTYPTKDVPFDKMCPIYMYCGMFDFVEKLCKIYSITTDPYTKNENLFYSALGGYEKPIFVSTDGLVLKKIQKYKIIGRHVDKISNHIDEIKVAIKYGRRNLLDSHQEALKEQTTNKLAIQYAVNGNQINILIWLLELSPDVKIARNWAFDCSFTKNKKDIAKYLDSLYRPLRINISTCNNIMQCGSTDHVDLYLQYFALDKDDLMWIKNLPERQEMIFNNRHFQLTNDAIQWILSKRKFDLLSYELVRKSVARYVSANLDTEQDQITIQEFKKLTSMMAAVCGFSLS